MKKTFLVTALIFCFTLISSQTKTFRGTWFEIKHPSTFIPKVSLKSPSVENGCESALFESQDKLVEFYVFSPQWMGNPTDIALKDTEKISSNKTKTSGNKTIKWWTIIAKDGSYTRSYEETKDNLSNTNSVVGIKYKNLAAYKKYKTEYLAFKSSLTQFAD